MRLVTGTVETDDIDALLDDLDSIADDHGVTIQAFDARYVADRAHLELAVDLADRAHGREQGIARDRGVEILLYAAGRRQIDRALEMGVAPGADAVVLVDGGDEVGAASAVRALDGFVPDDVTLGDPDRLRSFFDVSPAEERATEADLATLVAERTALLVVER